MIRKTMKETERIAKLFEDLYAGGPWIDVNLIDTLKQTSADVAARKIFLDWNSIWEITNHLISWRHNILNRLSGETVYTPTHNYFTLVEDVSEKAWKKTLKLFANSQEKWLQYLRNFKDEDLPNMLSDGDFSNYEYIQGILQHDAYHLGQIVMLLKLNSRHKNYLWVGDN